MPELVVIGVAHTPYVEPADCPKWPEPDGAECTIELDHRYLDGLSGVDELDEIDVLMWFDRAERSVLTSHPRGDRSRPARGVFALRSPNRPNPIAVSRVPVVRVEGLVVVVRGLDALDGTPVLDIKPIG